MTGDVRGLTARQAVLKRALDVAVAAVALVAASPVLALAWVAATLETRANGLFSQTRIGRGGTSFHVHKIRTMRVAPGITVTTSNDERITRSGAVLRKLKVDELPQLFNVLRGEMSLVGPRPDLPGFADRLVGGDRLVLTVRPGITGPASLAYRHEEQILARVSDPEAYNRDVIWPDKVRINREYVSSWTLLTDVRCLRDTVLSVFSDEE